MLIIAGGIILAVLFFVLLPLIPFLLVGAAAVVAVGALLAVVFVAEPSFTLASVAVLSVIGLLARAEWISRRDGVSTWHALINPGAKPPTPKWRGTVPKSWQE